MTTELERSVKRMCVGPRRFIGDSAQDDEAESTRDLPMAQQNFNSRHELTDGKSKIRHYGCCQASKPSGIASAHSTYVKSEIRDAIVDTEICQKLEDIIVSDNEMKESGSGDRLQRGCLQEAREEPDVSVDELAAYFDVQVHIPKKMSFMAELMYT